MDKISNNSTDSAMSPQLVLYNASNGAFSYSPQFLEYLVRENLVSEDAFTFFKISTGLSNMSSCDEEVLLDQWTADDCDEFWISLLDRTSYVEKLVDFGKFCVKDDGELFYNAYVDTLYNIKATKDCHQRFIHLNTCLSSLLTKENSPQNYHKKSSQSDSDIGTEIRNVEKQLAKQTYKCKEEHVHIPGVENLDFPFKDKSLLPTDEFFIDPITMDKSPVDKDVVNKTLFNIGLKKASGKFCKLQVALVSGDWYIKRDDKGERILTVGSE